MLISLSTKATFVWLEDVFFVIFSKWRGSSWERKKRSNNLCWVCSFRVLWDCYFRVGPLLLKWSLCLMSDVELLQNENKNGGPKRVFNLHSMFDLIYHKITHAWVIVAILLYIFFILYSYSNQYQVYVPLQFRSMTFCENFSTLNVANLSTAVLKIYCIWFSLFSFTSRS